MVLINSCFYSIDKLHLAPSPEYIIEMIIADGSHISDEYTNKIMEIVYQSYNLKYLEIWHFIVTQEMFDKIIKLTKLKKIHICRSNITCVKFDIMQLKFLNFLSISSSNLKNKLTICQELFNKKIKKVHFYGFKIDTDAIKYTQLMHYDYLFLNNESFFKHDNIMLIPIAFMQKYGDIDFKSSEITHLNLTKHYEEVLFHNCIQDLLNKLPNSLIELKISNMNSELLTFNNFPSSLTKCIFTFCDIMTRHLIISSVNHIKNNITLPYVCNLIFRYGDEIIKN